jgi:hypothetical protein
MNSGSIILLKHYSAIYLAIGGWDRMDCNGAHWMTCPINRTRHQSRRSGIILVVGDVGQYFS